jgi:hypothetical protein
MSMNMSPRPLYGGALTMDVLDGWLDTEAFMDIIKRPVPDNQEIFVAPSTESQTQNPNSPKPIVLFIDILEAAMDECPNPEDLPFFHATELLKRDERDAECESLRTTSGPSPFPVNSMISDEVGDGLVTMTSSFEVCDMEVCVIRMPNKATDLVFSLHGRIANANTGTPCPSLVDFVKTLHVEDWGLFGGGEGVDDSEEFRYLGS